MTVARRNIELKARLHDRDAATQACRTLNARPEGDIHQTDTYFGVPEGRLKLRESTPGDDYLVFYRRPDVAAVKGCDYTIAVVPRGLKPVLTAALGVIGVVDKVRTLYLWENVRIHLDRVQGLGDFIEFEAVLGAEYDDADGEEKLARLSRAFALAPADLLAHSYLELLDNAR
ncbi:MAG: class IV adenylate cyclase [Candidatus Hydrogenedentes bacterium]|nr:class IV adenylate cyclase [Candidatus Hydrogenedentota bacterium]